MCTQNVWLACYRSERLPDVIRTTQERNILHNDREHFLFSQHTAYGEQHRSTSDGNAGESHDCEDGCEHAAGGGGGGGSDSGPRDETSGTAGSTAVDLHRDEGIEKGGRKDDDEREGVSQEKKKIVNGDRARTAGNHRKEFTKRYKTVTARAAKVATHLA